MSYEKEANKAVLMLEDLLKKLKRKQKYAYVDKYGEIIDVLEEAIKLLVG